MIQYRTGSTEDESADDIATRLATIENHLKHIAEQLDTMSASIRILHRRLILQRHFVILGRRVGLIAECGSSST
jgi:hypothetical protein